MCAFFEINDNNKYHVYKITKKKKMCSVFGNIKYLVKN